MTSETGRPDQIEDILVPLHRGQWFGWTDSKEKVFANLVIYDTQYSKPTERELSAALTEAQLKFDAADYKRKRAAAYPVVQDQLDMQFHDAEDGTIIWLETLRAIKTKYPKPEGV